MSIQFMLLGGPRSGTTWAANWLTTDGTFCLHDPLMEYTVRHLENLIIPGRRLGISCTSSMLYPDWVLKHPAPKALLYRDVNEINRSLEALGLHPLNVNEHSKRMMTFIDAGVPVFDWKELFTLKGALSIWNTLLPDVPFDTHRHHLLTGMNVQPAFKALPVGKEGMADLLKRASEVII